MTDAPKLRPLMLAYTILFAAFLAGSLQESIQSQTPAAFIGWECLFSAIIVLGNLLYSLNRRTTAIRRIWRIVFPVPFLGFIVDGIIDFPFGDMVLRTQDAEHLAGWLIGFVLFFPTFRAAYLLGYAPPPAGVDP